MPGITSLTGNIKNTRTNNRAFIGAAVNTKPLSIVIAALAQVAGSVNTGKVQTGTIMGKRTADNKYLPCGYTTVPDGSEGAGATQTVRDSRVFRVGDVLSIFQADGTTDIDGTRTVTAIPSNTSITLNATITTVSESVIRRNDGTQNPVGVLYRDESTLKGHTELGAEVHGDQAGQIARHAILDWDWVIGACDRNKTLLEAKGFIIED